MGGVTFDSSSVPSTCTALIRSIVLPCTALYCSQFIQLYCMQSSQLADNINIALISCCVLSPDYVERISGATAVRYILRLTGLFLVH